MTVRRKKADASASSRTTGSRTTGSRTTGSRTARTKKTRGVKSQNSYPSSLKRLISKREELVSASAPWKKAIFTATITVSSVVETNCIISAETDSFYVCLHTKKASSKGMYSIVLKRNVVSLFGGPGDLSVIKHLSPGEAFSITGTIVKSEGDTITIKDSVSGEEHTLNLNAKDTDIVITASSDGSGRGSSLTK